MIGGIVRVPITSRALAEIGYDPETRTFEAQFPSKGDEPGAVWQYAPVEMDVWRRMNGEGASAGSIFAKEIKKAEGVFAERIDNQVPA